MGAFLRRRTVTVGSGALVVAAAVTMSLVLTSSRLALSVAPPKQQPGAGTTSVTPSWLPPGASLISAGPLPTFPGVTLSTPQPTHASYSLPGPANTNTINQAPAAPTLAQITSGLYHPATILGIEFAAGVKSIPPPFGNGFPGEVNDNVTIRGFSGLLSHPDPSVDPYGVVELMWIDPQGLHIVSCQSMQTASGTSGLSTADMLRVANSLYS